jgi:electron transfer flavoprotein alpha subunit
MKVLVVANSPAGELCDATREHVQAALSLGGGVVLGVVAENPEGVQCDLDGVDEVLTVRAEQGSFRPEVLGRSLDVLIASCEPDVTLTSFDVDSMTYAAGVAARRGWGFASDVQAVRMEDAEIIVTRPLYGGKLQGELAFSGRPVLLLLRGGVWASVGSAATAAPRSELTLPAQQNQVRFLRALEPRRDDVDITSAEVLLSIGRGVDDRDEVARLEALAERMGATLSVSRPLVDAGWVSSSRQVGQSGRTVAPRVYVALGISGAIQHLAGMRDSGTVIAVNNDANAAMIGVADHYAVMDLRDVVEELEQIYPPGR